MFKKNENLFLMARTVSYLGNKIFNYSLAFFILNKTGKMLDLAILFAVGILPEIIFNFVGGIVGDLFSKKHINIAADFIRALVLFLFFSFIDLDSKEYIYLISLLKLILSFVGVFIAPAIDGIVPEIILPKNLLKFNMKYTLFLDMVDISAPLIAGFIYVTLGVYHILLLDMLSFLISGVLFYFIKIEKKVSIVAIKNRIKLHLSREIIFIMIESFLFSIVVYPILEIYVIYYFIETLGFSDLKYGQYQSLLYFTSVLITFFLFKKVEKISKKSVYIFLLFSLGVLILFRENLFFYFLVFIILDNVSKFIKVDLDTKLQLLSPENSFAKISSLYWTLISLGIIIGNFILSSAIDRGLTSLYYSVIGVVIFLILSLK